MAKTHQNTLEILGNLHGLTDLVLVFGHQFELLMPCAFCETYFWACGVLVPKAIALFNQGGRNVRTHASAVMHFVIISVVGRY